MVSESGVRSRGVLPTAAAIVVLTPVVTLLLGKADVAKHHPEVWLLPVFSGLVPVVMGAVSAARFLSRRTDRGLWAGLFAVLLGGMAIAFGWYGLLLGEAIHNGPLW